MRLVPLSFSRLCLSFLLVCVAALSVCVAHFFTTLFDAAAAQRGVIRSLSVESRIPRQMFLVGGGDGVADADDEEELSQLCEGFSPDNLMVIVKKKSSGCVCVCVYVCVCVLCVSSLFQ